MSQVPDFRVKYERKNFDSEAVPFFGFIVGRYQNFHQGRFAGGSVARRLFRLTAGAVDFCFATVPVGFWRAVVGVADDCALDLAGGDEVAFDAGSGDGSETGLGGFVPEIPSRIAANKVRCASVESSANLT